MMPSSTSLPRHAAGRALALVALLSGFSASSSAQLDEHPLPAAAPSPSMDASAGTPAKLGGADALARAVLEQNPDLVAIEAQISAARSAVEQTTAWADPTAATEYSNMPLSRPYPGGHSMSGLQFRLQQTFPFPGKLAAREEAAKGQVGVVVATLAERQNTLVDIVRQGYVRLGLVRQLRTITHSHIELVSQLADVVQVRTEVGKANQVDLQRLQLLRSRLEDDLADYDRDEKTLVAALNAALHRDPTTPIDTPEVYPVTRPPPALDGLIAQAHENDPTLARLAAMTRAEKLSAASAHAERKPDVTGWVGYRLRTAVAGGDSGDDFASVGVSMPLPWFWNDRRWGSQEAIHHSRAKSADESRKNRADLLRGEVEAAHAALDRARQKGLSYRDSLVPDAHAVLDATFAVYPTGKADFESVYQAELQLLDFERTLRVSEATAWLSSYRLETLTAENLSFAQGEK